MCRLSQHINLRPSHHIFLYRLLHQRHVWKLSRLLPQVLNVLWHRFNCKAGDISSPLLLGGREKPVDGRFSFPRSPSHVLDDRGVGAETNLQNIDLLALKVHQVSS